MTTPATAPGQTAEPGQAALIGLDLGGSTVRVVVTGPGGVLHRATVRHAARGYPAVLALIDQVVAAARQAVSPRPVRAAGLAVAGWLSADREQLLAAANLGVAGVPLRRDAEQRLGLPVTVDNDGNAAALAEARAGAGRQARMLVMLTLGTGVGGGIVASGTLLTGAAGLAGELGHLPSVTAGPRCACGGRGCLEVYASGPAVARQAAAAGYRRAGPGKEPLTAEDVVAAARAGVPEAAGALAAAGEAVGRAVARLLPVLNPDIVLLGGGLAAGATDLVLLPARQALAQAPPLSSVVAAPPIRLATCGADAGALGASYLPDLNDHRTPAGASA
ncbi:MAG TPA: ROK family protein [Streptosporangiaceae bacterium]|nr:ROK family protein [Streptosporangiaceae bacterium]